MNKPASPWRAAFRKDGVTAMAGHIMRFDAIAMVAKFRATAAEQADNPRLRALTDDLVANSPEFRALWGGHDVRGHGPARKRIRHPTAGLIELDYVKLECVGRPGQLLTAHLPADAASAAKLRSLVEGS